MKSKKPNISDNTGKGKDRKGTKKDGLRYSWKWVRQCDLSSGPRNDKRRLPCRTCYLELDTSLGVIRFGAVDWFDSYEARVLLQGEWLVSIRDLPTRLDTQLAAEKGIVEFARELLDIVE